MSMQFRDYAENQYRVVDASKSHWGLSLVALLLGAFFGFILYMGFVHG